MSRLPDLVIVPARIAAAFDRHAASWDENHGPASPRRLGFALRAALLRDLLRRSRHRDVLDVGCATGCYLLAFGDLLERGVGIDISPVMIERARRKAGPDDRLRFEPLPVEKLASSGHGPFDLVLFLGSLEHMAEPARALEHASAVLRPGGLLAVVLALALHPRTLLAQREMRAGRIPPFRPIPPRAVRLWLEAAGLVRLGLRDRAGRPGARACWLIAATVMPSLGGSRMLVYRKMAAEGILPSIGQAVRIGSTVAADGSLRRDDPSGRCSTSSFLSLLR
jgi:SAM-dependent methyltransferase